MKAILIDVYNKDIKEVEYDGTLDFIYFNLACRTFDVVRIDDVNSIFVDDEGNSISPTLNVEDVKGKVSFLPEGFKVEPYWEVTSWD